MPTLGAFLSENSDRASDAKRRTDDNVIAMPPGLHPASRCLVLEFAQAMADKLRAAEEKYGYSDGWMTQDWEGECRLHLLQHLAKGDPRDVAIYAAFMWARGWSTAATEQRR